MNPKALILTAALLLVPLGAFAQPATPGTQPMKILVHITHGPEAPTRAALGFHVAKAALEEGHTTTVFLAGDAVQLLRQGTLDQLKGLGTGDLRELFDALVAGGASFYLSGGSSQARGLTQADLGDLSVTFGSPGDLVLVWLSSTTGCLPTDCGLGPYHCQHQNCLAHLHEHQRWVA